MDSSIIALVYVMKRVKGPLGLIIREPHYLV